MSCSRLFVFVIVGASAAVSRASSPDFQVVNQAAWDAVCRVVIGNQGMGTGTVFDKIVNTRDALGNPTNYWLCILTAGHVTNGEAPGNIRAGFGNQDLTGPGPGLTSPAVYKVDNPFIVDWHRDLSVFVVNVPANAFYNALVPIRVLPAYDPLGNYDDIEIDVGSPFSIVGYGNTGTFFNNGPAGFENGYRRHDGTFGVKRFVNQTVTQHDVRGGQGNPEWDPEEEGYPGGYCGLALDWELDGPMNAARVDGEGTAWGGDSGAPYLFDEARMPYSHDLYDWVTGNRLEARSRFLLGVHSGFSGTQAQGLPQEVKRWRYMDDGTGYGTSLSEGRVREWIHAQCMNGVPEPGTMLALAAGLGALVARRRRR